MIADYNTEVFLELVRAGLWEREARLSLHGKVDYEEVMRLAEEQSVVGIVTAGLEHVVDAKVPQEWLLQFIGSSLQLEQRNTAMNKFIAEMIDKMRVAGIYTLLVKGQGVAQCYERPLWRASGDVDLLLSNDNYEKAKDFLLPLSSSQKREEQYSKHLGLSIGEWYVEIHGSLRSGLSEKVDREIDAVQKVVHDPIQQKVRIWKNGEVDVMLPAPDEDVFFVFTHFIKHFYKEGLGLRQVCDWCRLLWTYRESLNHELLEMRLHRAGMMKEWKGFAAVAVNYMGMSEEAMPLYDSRFTIHADRILFFIMKGTRGKVRGTIFISKIFPENVVRFLPSMLFHLNWLKIKERLFGEC